MTEKLTLNLKQKYFYQIKNGKKTKEYRLYNDYWKARLIDKTFDAVEICLGYPPKGDSSKRVLFEWHGYEVETITHEFFNNVPQKVFSIDVSKRYTYPSSNLPQEQR